MTAVTIRIQEADFDIAQEIAALTAGRTDVGAVVSFSGICRGSENGEPIAALTLEHYPGMAEAEIKRHADEAMSRWPLTRPDRGASRRAHHARRKHRAGAGGFATPAGGVSGGRVPDGLSEGQRAVLEARGKRQAERAGSKRATMMTPPRRAGPNPDGQAQQASAASRAASVGCGQARPHGFEIPARSAPANC